MRGTGTAGSSAPTCGEKENCPGTIEARLSAVQVASDAKLLETSRGLGTGGPVRRAIYEREPYGIWRHMNVSHMVPCEREPMTRR